MRVDVVRADKVSKGLLRGGILALAALLCAPGCSSSESGPQVGTHREALSSLSEVLGFESPSDWSSQQAQLASSDIEVQGEASLKVTLTGYSQITSVPVGTLGTVGTSATLDVRLAQSLPWGEVRLVLRAPSLGEWWRDLGGQALGGLAAGAFHRLAFALPEDVRAKLGTSFDDLTFMVVLNGPSGEYLLDRLDFGVTSPPAPQTTEYTFTVALPAGAEPKDIVVAASTELRLADRVSARIGAAAAPLFNATGETELGVDVTSATLRSGGNVFLRDRSRVEGDVVSGGGITEQNAVVVTGQKLQHQPVPLANFSWSVRRAGSRGPVSLEPDTSSVIVPGAYGAVNVKSRAKLYLRGGEYFFRSVVLEPQAELILEDTAGPVKIYVESGLTHRGIIHGLGSRVPDLLLGYAGSDTVVLEAAFPGTVVAPNATVRLQPAPPGGHKGAFYAKRVFAEPDTVIQHRPFPWATMIDSPSTPLTPMPLTPSPVVLVAGRSYDPDRSSPGSANPASPVDFDIPSRIPVTGGNAGNREAILTFGTPGGQTVTCVYRGGATVEHPATPLEIARGREYLFESCSNGQVPGNPAQGTSFGLVINGDSETPHGSTHAELALGRASCSGLLPPPISAAQSIEMAENFDWLEQSDVAETNPDGHPALYYANIYIQNEEQLDLLKRFLIHYQTKPLFTTELRQYEGQCGTFEHAGDGQGQFVFAVIPGRIYNLIRDSAFRVLFPLPLSVGHRVLFKAIVMRPTPVGATYADGSLRYDHLMNAGFYYLNLRDMPPREALNEELLGTGTVSGDVFEIVEFIVDKAYAIGTAIVRVLGAVDRFLFGSVTVTLQLDILNRDPAFERNQPMQRAWHVTSPTRLGLPNVQVEILQWAMRPIGFYPTNTHSYNGENGTSSIEVSRSSGGLAGGTTPRGSSGVCYLMKNGMAELISGLLPNEVCDFRGSPEFGDFEESKSFVLTTDNYDAHVLNQVSEAYRFVTIRSGHVPRRARILTGATAAVVSSTLDSGLKRVWAPCLRFSGTSFNTLQFIGAGLLPWAHLVQGGSIDEEAALIFGLPWYEGRLSESDIVMPRHSSASTSRSVMVHEYGHFTMCSMLHEVDTDLLTNLTADVIAEGSTVQQDDEARILSESFADFIAGQVTGSTDYFNPGNTTASGAMFFCDGTGSQICLDNNLNEDDSGDNQIARTVTTWHDAFDGHDRGTSPTNGDSFRLEPSPTGTQCSGPGGQCLRYAPTTYGLDTDDSVQLPMSALAEWISGFATATGALREDNMMTALGHTMDDHGANWCQMCEVFGNHSPLRSGTTFQDVLEACTRLPIVVWIPGSLPNTDRRVQKSDCTTCPDGHISDANGVCVPCALGERVVGNTCTPCGVGQIVTAQGTCQDCGPHAIVVANTCVPCAFDQGADVATHMTCVACPMDAIVDLVGVPDVCDAGVTVTEPSIPSDPCPDQFWINVINLQDALNSEDMDWLHVGVTSGLSGNSCVASQGSLTFGTPLTGGGFSFGSTTTETGKVDPVGGPGCTYHRAVRLVSQAEIVAGASSRAVVASASAPSGALPASVTVTQFCETD